VKAKGFKKKRPSEGNDLTFQPSCPRRGGGDGERPGWGKGLRHQGNWSRIILDMAAQTTAHPKHLVELTEKRGRLVINGLFRGQSELGSKQQVSERASSSFALGGGKGKGDGEIGVLEEKLGFAWLYQTERHKSDSEKAAKKLY